MSGNDDIRTWFGFRKQPFSSDLKPDQLFLRPCLDEIADRIRFAVQNGMYFAVIGEVGAGKSTAMRYALNRLSPKQYQVLSVVGGNWTFVELLRQCMAEVGIFTRTNQQSGMLRSIYAAYDSMRESGKQPVIFIDEAHLFQQEVYNLIHLLSQQGLAGGRTIPIVMCGQEMLFEKLTSPLCKPLQSRILDGFNLHGMTQEETSQYIHHHLVNLGGGKDGMFESSALVAIHQTSAGIPRRINEICLLSLREAMVHEQRSVTIDSVRMSTRNWWER
jgi:general secretion pathway protein A